MMRTLYHLSLLLIIPLGLFACDKGSSQADSNFHPGVPTSSSGSTPTPTPAVTYGGFSHIQGNASGISSGLTVSATLSSSITAGHLVTCGVNFYDGTLVSATATAQDSNGNAYTQSTNSPSAISSQAGQVFLFYLLSAPANAGSTFTVTFNKAATFSVLWCDEFASTGAGSSVAFDTDAILSGSGSTTITGPSITPATSHELMYGACGDQASVDGSNSPWNLSSAGIIGGAGAEFSLNVSTTQTLNFGTENATDEWSCASMAFKIVGTNTPQGFSYVQGGSAYLNGGAGVLSVTLPSNPTPGDLVACFYSHDNGAFSMSMTSVLDANGNSYTVTPNSGTVTLAGGGQPFMAYLLSAPSNASQTITFTEVGGSSNTDIICDEFAVLNGTALFDQDAIGSGSAGTAINTPSLTPSGNGELVYGGCRDNGFIASVNGSWIWGSMSQDIPNFGSTNVLSAFNPSVSNSPYAINFVGSTNGSPWACMEMAFKFTATATGF